VWLADAGNDRIVEIAPDGQPLARCGDADLGPQGANCRPVSAASPTIISLTYKPSGRRGLGLRAGPPVPPPPTFILADDVPVRPPRAKMMNVVER
jgi:hypothetical protein